MTLHRMMMAAALMVGAAGCATTASTVATPEAGAATPQAGTAVEGEGQEIIVNVAGQRAPCTGVAPMLCLQVRTSPGAPWQLHYGDIEGFEFQPGAPWQLHYFEIEGFNWQPGTEYVIRVREFNVPNPPADAPSKRWVLEEVLESGPAM